MSVRAQAINQANVIIDGKISADILEEKSQKIAQQFAKTAKIQGFRKGKIPLSIIKSRYAKQIEQEVDQEVIRESFQEGLKELKIEQPKVLGNPTVTAFDRNENEIDLQLKVSITPNIDLSNLRSCVPDIEIKDPSSKEIDTRIQEITKNHIPLIEAKNAKKLEKGNTANIDFEGFIGEKAFDGGKTEGFDLLIGSGQFIDGFEDQIIGMKKGEERDIHVTFPDDYQAKDLAGKKAKFKVKLNAIKVNGEIQIDDAFAQKILNQADATLSTLKEQVKLQLKNEARIHLYNQEAKPKFIEKILQTLNFDLPDLIVEQEMNILLNNYARTLTPEELEAFKQDSKRIEEKRKELHDEAQKSVKITFIIDAASKEYKIQIQDNEVIQALYYEAMMAGQDPKAMLNFYQQNNLLPAVKMAMLEDRILTMLLDEKLNSAQKSQDDKKKAKEEKTKGAAKGKSIKSEAKTKAPKQQTKTK